MKSLGLAAAVVVAALVAAPVAKAATNPPITARDTLRQVDPRRLPYTPNNENARHPVNMRPSISKTWVFNGRFRTSTWLQTTGRNLETLNGKRAVPNRFGRIDTNSNRTTLIRRRAAIPRR